MSLTVEQQQLWNQVRIFEIGDPNADFTFVDRLARENSWSTAYAARALLEYKKFMFLICFSSHPLTPSDQVDQVWHLHLLYTQSYWEDFCQHTLKRTVHHGPTRGGQSEKNKYGDLYERTIAFYSDLFDKMPPLDIWPPGKIRFGEINFSRVNRHRHWVIRKPVFLRKWKF